MLQKDCDEIVLDNILQNEIIRIILKIISLKDGVNQTLSSYILDSILNNSKSTEKIKKNELLLKDILKVVSVILNSKENENNIKVDKFMKHILKSYLKIAKICIEKGIFTRKFPKILFKKSFYKSLDDASRKSLNSFYSFFKKNGTFIKLLQNQAKEEEENQEILSINEKENMSTSSFLKDIDERGTSVNDSSTNKSKSKKCVLDNINISPIKPSKKDIKEVNTSLSIKGLNSENNINKADKTSESLNENQKVAYYQINNNFNIHNNQNYYSGYYPQMNTQGSNFPQQQQPILNNKSKVSLDVNQQKSYNDLLNAKSQSQPNIYINPKQPGAFMQHQMVAPQANPQFYNNGMNPYVNNFNSMPIANNFYPQNYPQTPIQGISSTNNMQKFTPNPQQTNFPSNYPGYYSSFNN